jgi:hypothetical protein
MFNFLFVCLVNTLKSPCDFSVSLSFFTVMRFMQFNFGCICLTETQKVMLSQLFIIFFYTELRYYSSIQCLNAYQLKKTVRVLSLQLTIVIAILFIKRHFCSL